MKTVAEAKARAICATRTAPSVEIDAAIAATISAAVLNQSQQDMFVNAPL